MSDDQRPGRPGEHDEPKDEVVAHHGHGGRISANDEPADEGNDEVEAHHGHGGRISANDEPGNEGDDEVEAHRGARQS